MKFTRSYFLNLLEVILILFVLCGCTEPTPSYLKKKDSEIAKCKSDCSPREDKHYIGWAGDVICLCKE